MDPAVPQISVTLWRSDAIVLLDWLETTDLDQVPISHPSQKQALMDLLTRLEIDTEILYGQSGDGLTQHEIETAQAEVARDMGW
ncbi:MAG: hypothetical protein GY946_18930 [bacterium]|nr:hypothetical protein [bacterium]